MQIAASIHRFAGSPTIPWATAVCVATILAFLIRLPVVLRTSMWIDDGATLHTLALPLGDLWAERLRMGHLPGFFYLFRSWVALAGESLLALRMPSLVASALTVPVLMLVAERLGARRAALIAGAIGILHGTLLRNAAEMRMYPWLTLLGGCLLLATLAHWERPTAPRAAAIGLCHFALLQLHANAFIWSIFFVLAIGALAARAGRSRAWWMGFVGAFALACVATLPVMLMLLQRFDTGEFEKFNHAPTLAQLFTQHFELVIGLGARTKDWRLPLGLALPLVAVLWLRRGREEAAPGGMAPRDLALLCFVAGLLPPTFAWTVSVLGRPMLGEPRYFTQGTVGLLALVAAGIARWKWLPGPRGAAASLLSVAVLAMAARESLGRSADVLRGRGMAINRLVAEIERDSAPGTLIVITHSVSVPEIVHYYVQDEARFTFLDVDRRASEEQVRDQLRAAVQPDRDVVLFLYKALDTRVETMLRTEFGPWADVAAEDDDQPTYIRFDRLAIGLKKGKKE